MKLLELQRQMAADLMRPLTAHDNLSPKVDAKYIKPNDRLTAHERLEIYSRSYWYRILDSLYDDFPGLRAIIGDDAFDKLARAYLITHASRSFTMRDLGCELENWLRPRPRYTAGKHAMALDMVRLEWAHIEAFDGPAATPLGPEDLIEFDGGLRMRLQPYLSLIEIRYAVDDLRIAVTRNPEFHNSASNAVAAPKHRARRLRSAKRLKSAAYVAVHRYENTVYYRRLEAEAYRILFALGRGDTLAEAIEAGSGGSDALAKWFAAWSELGWLCKYEESR